ncbi:MAG TPA: SMC-Scp complex subunit ScpB [Tissierellaceae bacterium]|nr:SMC-Scp complex subunit ScpB [Tissierellaceae bacterium]
MDKKKVKAIIEALLFTWGDPLSLNDISEIMHIDMEELAKIMKEMIDDFNYEQRGLRIIRINNSYQIGTRPEYYDWIKQLQKQDPPKSLTNAALETLAIIAYKQPVIKSDIDYIRGVKSDRALQTLTERGLIKELGRLDRPGRPIIYGTTKEFLKLFSLESLDELPDLDRIEEELKKLEK